MNCPKCKAPGLRQQVSVFIECDADRTNLSKRGIRSADVKVMGAGWPQAVLFCAKCPYMLRLKA